jgi:Mg/Co/Ni transporter MgtE
MGVLTGGFSLGDRLPPGRDEKMTLTQKVNDEEKDREVLWLLKEMVKKAIEEMMKEERVEYLDEHPETKGNGYYTSILLPWRSGHF